MTIVDLKHYFKTEAELGKPNIIKIAVRVTGQGHYVKLDSGHVNFVGTNKIPFKDETNFNIDLKIIDTKSFKFSGADGLVHDGVYHEKDNKLILKFLDTEKQNITIYQGGAGSCFKYGLATCWIGKK